MYKQENYKDVMLWSVYHIVFVGGERISALMCLLKKQGTIVE